jgi:hypothetical protein
MNSWQRGAFRMLVLPRLRVGETSGMRLLNQGLGSLSDALENPAKGGRLKKHDYRLLMRTAFDLTTEWRQP